MRFVSPIVMAVVAAIGCGSKPQEATATTQPQEPERPIVLAQAPAGAGPAGSAALAGSVKLDGAAPVPEKVKMDADPVCKQQHATAVMKEDVVAGADGGLKNVFVYVKEGLSGSYPAPSQPVVLDQKGCWYTPHVFGIQVDQPLEIVNSDATLHNVNAKPSANPAFNLAQPSNKTPKATKKFSKPEVGVKFKCNVHPWMSAYGHVVSHPFFAVTGESGAFTISGLPAGTYTLEAWHEKYGTQTQSITVGEGASQTVGFTFKAQ